MKSQVAHTRKQSSTARIRRLHDTIHDRIGVKLASSIECIHLDEIVCCEAWGNYCKIHISGRKDALVMSKPLKHLCTVLPDTGFFRTHQSYIIRVDAIRSVSDEIELTNGMRVPLSRSHKPAFMQWLKQNITLI